jgi:hypothetical protein
VVRIPGYKSRGPCSIPSAITFLRSSGSGTGSTQPREYNEELLGRNSSGSGFTSTEATFKCVFLSYNTISRRIQHIAEDLNDQLIGK